MSTTTFPTIAEADSDIHLRKRKPIRISAVTLTVLFIILAFIFLLPLYWMIISSLKPQEDIFSSSFSLLPARVTFDNYSRLFTTIRFPQWFLNSVLQSGGYAVLSVTVCALGGFALAKYHFRGRNLIFLLILLIQMVPFHLLIVSLFVMVVNLKLVDTYLGAILPLAAQPIGIFFMRQYMLALDDEILNSARVDGANEYQLFFSIVVPNIKPAVATLLVLFSLEYWNNLLWPMIVFRTDTNFPLAVGIASLVSQYRSAYDLVMAASTLATLPIIVLFFFLRRQFMEGIAATGSGLQ